MNRNDTYGDGLFDAFQFQSPEQVRSHSTRMLGQRFKNHETGITWRKKSKDVCVYIYIYVYSYLYVYVYVYVYVHVYVYQ